MKFCMTCLSKPKRSILCVSLFLLIQFFFIFDPFPLFRHNTLFHVTSYAQELTVPNMNITMGTTDDPAQVATSLQVLFFLSIIALAPTLIFMLTGFTRIIIALHFVRSALGTQQMPPNQVLVGLALFITLFMMAPIMTEINENAVQPYSQGQITTEEALEAGFAPLREFMFAQVENKDMALFVQMSGRAYASYDQIPNTVLIPAFILGEITKGFKFGFIIYLPFIVIDMVVASVLMAMGMMMLPPAMISLPFKILLFVMADGWSLVIENLLRTFR